MAARQFGRVSRAQMLDHGIDKSAIERWVHQGYLHRVHPGVYAVGHIADSIEGDLAAALLYAGRGAMLSHASAAWWWGLIDQMPSKIHVTVAGRRRSARAVVVHDRRMRARAWHKRLPVTSVVDTLVDFAATASLPRVRRALAEADYQQLLTVEHVAAALVRGRRGAANLRDALARHQPRLALTRSRLERAFLALCESAGLPMPEINATVGRMTVDAVWRRERVAVELDGFRAHRTRAQLEGDRRRELRLRALGFTVARYVEDQVVGDVQLVVRDLTALVSSPPETAP